MRYVRIGPTPWVRTSRPASVSIGEPRLPAAVPPGPQAGVDTPGRGPDNGSSGVHQHSTRRSARDRAAKRPLMRRGNSARPDPARPSAPR